MIYSDYDNDYEFDYCYECRGYGDDYVFDEKKNEWVSACDGCPYDERYDADEWGDPWDE